MGVRRESKHEVIEVMRRRYRGAGRVEKGRYRHPKREGDVRPLSTIINADRIYVLRDGRMVQSGTYNELMQQKGLVADLAKRQMV
jgi:hypothetical protein